MTNPGMPVGVDLLGTKRWPSARLKIKNSAVLGEAALFMNHVHLLKAPCHKMLFPRTFFKTPSQSQSRFESELASHELLLLVADPGHLYGARCAPICPDKAMESGTAWSAPRI